MKLLVGIPSYDYMHAEFVKCLKDLVISEEVCLSTSLESLLVPSNIAA